MKRIKTVGLAAVMALALAATVGAASASASGFVADEYYAGIEGNPKGVHQMYFSGMGYTCSFSAFHAGLEGPAEALAPSAMADVSCVSSRGEKATLEMKGCAFIFHPDAETSEGAFNGAFDMGSVGCGPMVLNGTECERTFSPQAGFVAGYVNNGEGSKATVGVKASAFGINFTVTKGPAAVCGTSGSSGTYDGSWEIQALDVYGNLNGLHVDETGVYMAGEESGEANQPRFEAEDYPLSLLGDQDPASKHLLTIQGRKLSCEEVHFEADAGGATTELSVEADYDGCQLVVSEKSYPTTVVANSCHYVLHVLNVGPPYAGQADVACAEGDAVEVKTYETVKKQVEGKTMCVYKVGAQSGLGSVGYSTVGEGSGRGIAVSLGLEGIKYSATGSIVLCGTSGSKATYAGGVTLHGLH
ncbi:MAG TPA: hypothetical protein VNT92_09640 [Acidimicrobiia bacterium]|nr:hypothetical protein [Acidimicrobiia bacterium]